jgi:hypothetical protein
MRIAPLLFLTALVFGAEPSKDWSRVVELKSGDRIEIDILKAGSVKGRFRSLTDEAILLEVRDKEVRGYQRKAVQRVWALRGSRLKNTLLGAAVGFGVGFPIGYVSTGAIVDQDNPPAGTKAQGGAAIGLVFAGVAAGISAAQGGTKRELVYDGVPPPTGSYTGTRLLYQPGESVKKGATAHIKIQLSGADGRNVSSFGHVLRVTGVSTALQRAADVTPLSRDSNPEEYFRYDAGLGGSGGYAYDLNTSGLEPGSYNLHFRVGNDPQTHAVPFKVK